MATTSSAGDHSHGIDLSAYATAADLAALTARVAALEAPPITDLQAAINAAKPGDTIDLGGQTFAGAFTVPTAITLRNGHLMAKADQYALTVTAAATITGLTIDGGYVGVCVAGATGARIIGNTLTGLVYAGVMTLGATNALVDGNTIDRVIPLTDADGWNAYGITFTSNAAYPAKSTGCVASNNKVSHVPTWHGLDTHGGVSCQFIGNRVSGVRRAVAITANAAKLQVSGNDLTAPTAAEQQVPAGCPPTFGTDYSGIWFVAGSSASFATNTGHNYGARWYNPVNGGGTIIASSGNSPSVP